MQEKNGVNMSEELESGRDERKGELIIVDLGGESGAGNQKCR